MKSFGQKEKRGKIEVVSVIRIEETKLIVYVWFYVFDFTKFMYDLLIMMIVCLELLRSVESSYSSVFSLSLYKISCYLCDLWQMIMKVCRGAGDC